MPNAIPQLTNVPNTIPRTQGDWQNFQNVLAQWKNTLTSPRWVAPTLLHSWANYGNPYSPAGYYLDSTGRVWLRGVLKSGASGTVAFQMPYTPAYTIVLALGCIVSAAYTPAQATIDTSGNLSLAWSGALTSISLDGSSFSLLA